MHADRSWLIIVQALFLNRHTAATLGWHAWRYLAVANECVALTGDNYFVQLFQSSIYKVKYNLHGPLAYIYEQKVSVNCISQFV